MPPSATSAAATSLAIAGAVLLFAVARRRRPKRLAFHQRWVSKADLKAFKKEIEVAVELAIECGEAMLKTAGAEASMKDGQDGIDPQTAVDLSNERLVMDTLKVQFPNHGLIGEETAAAAGKVPEIESRPTWIVDPIDGTQNFCSGLPIAAVSIGLCINGKPALGVVYDPYRGMRLPLHTHRARADGRAHTACTDAYPCAPTVPVQTSSSSASPTRPPLSTACGYMAQTAVWLASTRRW